MEVELQWDEGWKICLIKIYIYIFNTLIYVYNKYMLISYHAYFWKLSLWELLSFLQKESAES